MFRRFPYPGWLLVILLIGLSAAAFNRWNIARNKPERITREIAGNVKQQLKEWDKIKSDQKITSGLFEQELTEEELESLFQLPFQLYARENDSLIFWNKNIIYADCNDEGQLNEGAQPDNSIFYSHCDTISKDPLRTITVVIPIAWIYPFENNYLQSHWVASKRLPTNIKISRDSLEGYYPVRINDQKPLFYLRLPDDYNPARTPFIPTALLSIFAVVCICIWVNFNARYLAREKNIAVGLIFLVCAVIVGRGLVYMMGRPFQMDKLSFFSPQLYASSRLLPSLGDLVVNSAIFTWVCLFIFTQSSFRTFTSRLKSDKIRGPFLVLQAFFMIGCTSLAVRMIRSVVMDSMISFEVSNFYAIDWYTVTGLISIMLTVASCSLLLYMQNVQLNYIGKWKYPLVVAAGAIYILIFHPNHEPNLPNYYLLIWLLVYMFVIDKGWIQISRDLLAPKTILWGVFLSLSTTLIMQHFNFQKERETRKLYATKLLQQKDPVTEYLFKDLTSALSKDPKIQGFFEQPGIRNRRELENRIELLYLQGHLSKYQAQFFLFQPQGQGLFNTPAVTMKSLDDRIVRASKIEETNLYFIENAVDNHYYIARIPIQNKDSLLLGYVFVDLTLKKENNETVYPELLQPGHIDESTQRKKYHYAIYQDNRLIAQSGPISFPLEIDSSQTKNQGFIFNETRQVSTLWYHTDSEKSVSVVYYKETWLRLTTMFSYLFSVLLLIMMISILLSVWVSYASIGNRSIRIGNITLRRRIHYAMLGIVLASFLVIGIATITFFNNRYKDSSKDRLQEITRNIENSLKQYSKEKNFPVESLDFSDENLLTELRYMINALANQYKTDINLFSTGGTLTATSRTAVFDKHLLAPVMRADAFHELEIKKASLLIQREKIGSLSYLSGYVPLQLQNGLTAGYLNIPYYASQDELKYQVSNILIALINLYAFILLISSLLAVIITNKLTRSLHMIIDKFKRLNLQQNELIDWPYDDEIGLLVKEYNKMVQKVESHAQVLARNERETAWREMARQVAHEIKNPLTPMKLNIQYLQQALKQNHPNINDLTTRISASIIEQIDNLSYIASEFSNFAKMPEAQPSVIELNETLERAVELYLNKNNVTVTFHSTTGSLPVYIDKSQLLRVCTNLIQNAIQAIPEGEAGMIEISLDRDQKNVILSISDNGGGIPEQFRDNIFMPYFTTKSSGTGLGLAMTRNIIEFWKGKIWFKTEEGKGTVFFIKLPLYKSDSEEDNAE